MATSKVKIISAAFILLGKKPINDIVTSDQIIVAASGIYDILYEDLLSAYPWRFAMMTQQLSLLVAKPIIDRFTNAFLLPPNMILAYRPEELVDYEIFEDTILTNNSQVKLDFVFPANESRFPAYFTRAFVHMLASEIAMSVTQTISIAGYWEKISERSFIRAKSRDGQQMPNPFVRRDPLLSARLSTGRLRSAGAQG